MCIMDMSIRLLGAQIDLPWTKTSKKKNQGGIGNFEGQNTDV